MNLPALLADEPARQREFPVCAQKDLPRPCLRLRRCRAWRRTRRSTYARASTVSGPDDYVQSLRQIRAARETCARMLPGATPEEIALLGPTSLGLSLFAGGLDWQPGDEVLYYADDYPANVYPVDRTSPAAAWCRARLQPERPGEITPALVESALTPRTRLVALASAFFLTGYRIDVDAIGQLLGARGVLFSVDAIQTLGAMPLSVRHVDFLAPTRTSGCSARCRPGSFT